MQREKLFTSDSLKIAFINPPPVDWTLANNLTYLLIQSHYNRHGKKSIEWIEAPYRWDKYETVEDVLDEIHEADLLLCSSYVWNYRLIDKISEAARNRGMITAVGGPHISTQTVRPYDFICPATYSGEKFFTEILDGNGEYNFASIEYSPYEEHFDYLKKLNVYSHDNNIEPFIVLETTRGCPYQCVYCEWGGGINTKIKKKNIEVIKRDIDFIVSAGYKTAYLTDANFGAFFDRDIEILRYAWNQGLTLSDISTMKSQNLKRRIALIDAWFDTVKDSDISVDTPSVAIQTISEEAMAVSKRKDLSYNDKIKLSQHIRKRCLEENMPRPTLEMILGLPGSTIDDFYDEMELIFNFQAWGNFRHDYMFLPDTELATEEYIKKYNITVVNVYDNADESGVSSLVKLYADNDAHFDTIASCYSYTKEDMYEMWFMNIAGNYLLQHCYNESITTPSNYCRIAYQVIKQIPGFDDIHEDIIDILNPNTSSRCIHDLLNGNRVDVINNFLSENIVLIKVGIMSGLNN